MGARSVPHPAPGPGAAPGSIAAARPGLSAGLDDPKPIPRSEVGALRALEDVPDPGSREQQPVRWNPSHGPNAEITVQQHRRDRKAHPEGVDRSCALEEEGRVRGQGREATQPLHPFTPSLGNQGSQDQIVRVEDGGLSHGPTVARSDDDPPRSFEVARRPRRQREVAGLADAHIDGVGGGGQDSNPRTRFESPLGADAATCR
jgi:hypothetical protein